MRKVMDSYARLCKIINLMSLEYYILSAVVFTSSFCSLHIHDENSTAPYFEARDDNVAFRIGETATLLCAVANLNTRFVYWRRTSESHPLIIGDFVYSPDQRHSIKRVARKNEWNLVIRDLQADDAGVYECAISTKEKDIRRLVILRVNDKISIKPQIIMSGKGFVSKGQKIVLTCNITGGDHYTPDGVDWFINGHKVDHRTMPRMRIYNKVDNQLKTFYSTLEIRRSLMDDKGMYVCRGPYSKTSSISLHVLDEQKSSVDKRDFANDSAISRYSFQWKHHCCVFLFSLSATLTSHIWLTIR
ncbi:uncharacterized protein [Mytilus edulis]|uniref:uncharacterized protein n=1 Tax=Mytilus edulis TaxID=6550 RepID=UPI0039F0533E